MTLIGIELEHVSDLQRSLDNAFNKEGFDYIVAPITHPRLVREPNSDRAPTCFSRSDLMLSTSQWAAGVVGKLTRWSVRAAAGDAARRAAASVLDQELRWAAHLALTAVLLEVRATVPMFARVLASALQRLQYMHVLLRVPMQPATALRGAENQVLDDSVRADDDACVGGWPLWNSVRLACEQHPHLFVALELSADLPSETALERWQGEPVRVLLIPISVFLTNRHGHPVLSVAHQAFVRRMLRYGAQLIVSGAEAGKALSYNEYLRHIAKSASDDQKTQFERPYFDVLQAPLQPLQDNLESSTYETFERDPVKYAQYREAIRRALLDRNNDNGPIVLMVVGAGRGPLVRQALAAAEAAERQIRVFAVEKNVNAVVTLENLRRSEPAWRKCVTIVSADMRQWQAPEKADILVSELLGSFGDNECSPECLDGAQRFLKDGGISIPSAYTSFLAPLTSQRLFNQLCALGAEHERTKLFETPYVVKLHNMCELAPPQACFVFEHPTPQPANNERYTALEFRSRCDALLHGFAGYFDATLYKDVHCSILPSTHSPGMFSWFPIWFPLREPVVVKRDASIKCQFWRVVQANRIHYEWAADQSHIHNINGRSYFVGL